MKTNQINTHHGIKGDRKTKDYRLEGATVASNTEPLTIEQFKRALPKTRNTAITQEIVDGVNSIITDSATHDAYRENLLSYTTVLKNNNFKIGDYVRAVRYVTHRLLGCSNIVSWTKAFPERYQRLLNENASQATIDSTVSMYNKNMLVNKIMEQTLIPTHIINADLHQKAINQLAYLMMNANSEKVQSDSAGKLVDVLKIPETFKVELDIGFKEDDSIKELRETTLELVRQQKLAIEAGANTVKEIAHSKIIGNIAEIEDVEVVEIIELKEVD